jgi:hypothetical protein
MPPTAVAGIWQRQEKVLRVMNQKRNDILVSPAAFSRVSAAPRLPRACLTCLTCLPEASIPLHALPFHLMASVVWFRERC